MLLSWEWNIGCVWWAIWCGEILQIYERDLSDLVCGTCPVAGFLVALWKEVNNKLQNYIVEWKIYLVWFWALRVFYAFLDFFNAIWAQLICVGWMVSRSSFRIWLSFCLIELIISLLMLKIWSKKLKIS